MFRRKEENANDASPESAQTSMPITGTATGLTQDAQPASSASSSVSSSSTAPAASSATGSAQTPGYSSPYAPGAQNQAAAARPAAAAATPGYRPAPLGDFSRGQASPRASEAQSRGAATATSAVSAASSGASPVSSFSLSDKASQKTNRRVLTVGNDILLKGEIATCDRLVIEGRVEAKLSDVHTVEIAECGSFKGTAEVEDAEISGVFEGDLVVRNRLVIYSSGEVRGNITYGEIEIERGGKLTGQIKTVAMGGATATITTNTSKTGLSAQEVKARIASEFAA